jgi:hypothetical protein
MPDRAEESVDFLTLFSVRQKHGAEISLSANSDQGFSPWTSPAFLKNCWSEKLYFL